MLLRSVSVEFTNNFSSFAIETGPPYTAISRETSPGLPNKPLL